VAFPGAGGDEPLNTALRPQRRDACVVQPKRVETLRIALQAITERTEPTRGPIPWPPRDL